ncbi:MarR family winged helix-turn-helix transcriptional regulator [Sinomonas sp. P10A9]|uniref:MarR family winged helix-turn-helix transcriptional regulator n=1 Tax=Sinomonas puerhi TaxID=3238584 RepID=A0AB39L7R0_9MICC
MGPAAETEDTRASELAALIRVPVTILADALRRAGSSQALPSAQAQTLSQLSAGEPMSVSDLAGAQELAVSSMTEVVQRLERKGLVERAEDHDGDRRRVFVAITPEGLYRLRESIAARDSLVVKRLEGLEDHELELLARAAPLLWRLARLDPEIWPRIPGRPPRPRSRELP